MIGAGAGIYSSSQASHAQTSAANTASNDQLLVANENNQLARDMYAANASRLDPYSTMGLAAGDQYMGLLLGEAPQHGQPAGSGWAPVIGNPGPAGSAAHPTPTPAPGTGTGTTPTSTGYTGPTLSQIMAMQSGGQGAINAYLSYYQAHPDQDPGFTTISPFHGDPYVDESAASSVLAARNAYISSHPGSTGLPGLGGAPTGGSTTLPSFGGSALSPVVAQQAQQAIAAGANPQAVAERAASYGVRLNV